MLPLLYVEKACAHIFLLKTDVYTVYTYIYGRKMKEESLIRRPIDTLVP